MIRQRMYDEQGFTMIELLIAVMVSGVILAALATGFIVTMKGTRGAHERLVESHDAQLLAVNFPSDVQSADPALIALDASAVTNSVTPPDCSASLPAGSNNMLRLRWTELASGSSLRAFSVSYRLESAGGQSKLVRYYCTGTTPITTPLPLDTAQRRVALQAALAGVTATSEVVAHDLSPSQPVPTIAGRKVSWSLITSPKPPEIEPGQYTFGLSASMRNLGTATAAPPAGNFVLGGMPASITAGSPFSVTITLAGFSGPKNLTWSGPGAAPNGTAGPSYPANPVVFDGSGQATVSVTLAKAEATTLTVSDGTRTGQTTFTVNGGTAAGLAFTNCSANGGPAGSCSPNVAVGGNNGYMDGFVSVLDAYGNAAGVGAGDAWTIGVTSSDGNFVVSNSPVTITSPASQSATTFHVEHTSNGNGSATLTATSVPVLSPASMTVSKS